MPIENTLTEIAIVVTVALVCGITLEKLKQPAVLGYILAGIFLGPSILGFIENRDTVFNLAELGVLMLLFVVGMELDLRSFTRKWLISISCVVLQIVGGFAIAFPLSYLFHWPLNLTLLLAFVFALSSTAVAVKMLDEAEELKTKTGRLTISILVAQDLAIVPMILFIRGIQPEDGGLGLVLMSLKLIISIGLLALLVWHLSRRERIRLPFLRMVVGHTDLTPLMGLTCCFGAAAAAGLSGLSAAYGAFLAGLVIGNSHERQAIIDRMTPIYSVLMMVFFLSIGLLLDLDFVWHNLIGRENIFNFHATGDKIVEFMNMPNVATSLGTRIEFTAMESENYKKRVETKAYTCLDPMVKGILTSPFGQMFSSAVGLNSGMLSFLTPELWELHQPITYAELCPSAFANFKEKK